MKANTKQLLLVFAIIFKIFGIFFFINGFFPFKLPVEGKSTHSTLIKDAISTSKVHDVPEPVYDRLVIMVVDALRNDFVFGQNSSMEFTRRLLSTGKARGYTALASIPTVTLPRINALTTGTLPGYVDAVLNLIDSHKSSTDSAKQDDSIIWQFVNNAKKKVYMFGDDTWLRLFPNSFTMHEGTNSFYVQDTTIVDLNVTRHLDELLDNDSNSAKSKWDILVLHYLGLDHIGHLEGPNSKLMRPKQIEMDQVVKRIYKSLEERDLKYKNSALKSSLFVILGDHGMNDIGNHGGNSIGEISPAMVFTSPSMSSKSRMLETGTIQQIDIVPTISMLMGIPIPQNNIGTPITELFENYNDTDLIKIYELSALQIRKVVKRTFGNSAYKIKKNTDIWNIINCELLSTEADILECKFLHTRSQHLEIKKVINNQSSIEDEALQRLKNKLIENYKSYCNNAYKIISTNVTLKSARKSENSQVYLWYFLISMTIMMSISVFSTSFIEEENLIWFYFCQTLLIIRILYLVYNNLHFSGEMLKSLIITFLTRIFKDWYDILSKLERALKGSQFFWLKLSDNNIKILEYPQFVRNNQLSFIKQNFLKAGCSRSKKIKLEMVDEPSTPIKLKKRSKNSTENSKLTENRPEIKKFDIKNAGLTLNKYATFESLQIYTFDGSQKFNNTTYAQTARSNFFDGFYYIITFLFGIIRSLYPLDSLILCRFVYISGFFSALVAYVLRYVRLSNKVALLITGININSAFYLDMIFSIVPTLILVTKYYNALIVFTLVYFISFGIYSARNASYKSDKISLNFVTSNNNNQGGKLIYTSRNLINTNNIQDFEFMAILLIVTFRFIHYAFGNSNSLSTFDLSTAYLGVGPDQPQDFFGATIYKGFVLGLTLCCNFASIILSYLGAGAIFSSYSESSGFSNMYYNSLTVTRLPLVKKKTTREIMVFGINLVQSSLLLSLFVAATALRTHLFIWSVFAPKVLYAVALEIISLCLSLFILIFY
ncbi:hypothetical protein BB561_000130 [Smittium simulii]|uniref:GPI ethanolamine phosphate transferase 2 n=1 Tax=Smittium simulii TaxID=133385 RepID=A0A2T9Z0F3_9FUNG|nr:hypothetical protein BB561_000130 [Smittium simulii]